MGFPPKGKAHFPACQKTLFDTLAEVKEAAKTSKPDLRLYSLYAWVRFAL